MTKRGYHVFSKTCCPTRFTSLFCVCIYLHINICLHVYYHSLYNYICIQLHIYVCNYVHFFSVNVINYKDYRITESVQVESCCSCVDLVKNIFCIYKLFLLYRNMHSAKTSIDNCLHPGWLYDCVCDMLTCLYVCMHFLETWKDIAYEWR